MVGNDRTAGNKKVYLWAKARGGASSAAKGCKQGEQPLIITKGKQTEQHKPIIRDEVDITRSII